MITLKGNGANGKSYLLELVRNLLGGVDDHGYGCKLPIQFLIEKEPLSNSASPALMPLEHARLAYFSESDKSEVLRAAKKKQLLSHEPLSIRGLYGKQQNIDNRANLVCASNYDLINQNTDHGTWRREAHYEMKIKLCSNPDPTRKNEKLVDLSFTKSKSRDPEFLSGMLGILTMYLGILDLKYGGDVDRVPHDTIMTETERFRNTQDILNRFITERIVTTPDENLETRLVDAVDIYCHWYDKNVKACQHDRRDISLMFQNSRLAGSLIREANGTIYLKNHRVLQPGEEKADDEEYLIRPMLPVEEEKSYVFESSDDLLQRMYDEYIELLST
jgi:phage/plasmid-associated DNA primase